MKRQIAGVSRLPYPVTERGKPKSEPLPKRRQFDLAPLPCMHSPAASTSALPAVENHDADKISAYYSLAFPNFTYYLQTLTVTIGRRPFPSATATEVSLVDVDLGPLKSVSRLHARIEYEEDEERFVLVVLGRNGAWVDGIWAGSGSKVPLGARWDSS